MSNSLSPQIVKAFQAFIYSFYRQQGRVSLPWRQTTDPYLIMVSEIMLQQTQVDRVIPKFHAFTQRFPTVESLSQALPAEVITHWQGLGYNRRGLNLHRAAQYIQTHYNGQLPLETEKLLKLPGIGPYSSAAVQAFAFNQPVTVIETNIRTIYLHHFFYEQENIADTDILPLISLTLDLENPRLWYSALMDYGTYLKRIVSNPSRRSKTYAKQSTFEGSNRQARGMVLQHLTQKSSLTTPELDQLMGKYAHKLEHILPQLIKEGFISYSADTISLTK